MFNTYSTYPNQNLELKYRLNHNKKSRGQSCYHVVNK